MDCEMIFKSTTIPQSASKAQTDCWASVRRTNYRTRLKVHPVRVTRDIRRNHPSARVSAYDDTVTLGRG